MAKASVSEQVAAFKAACAEHGFSYEVTSPNVLRITKTVRNNEEFVAADMMAGSVLDLAPLRGGSVWGTDGGSIGGAVALRTGRFVMNKSGTAKLFMAALAKS